MKHFLNSFLLWLKLQFRTPKSWILVILLPAVMLAAVLLLPQEESAAPVQVGVCLPDRGAEQFWDVLTDRSEAVISFCLTDEETIIAKVATGQWDCGIVLAEDFAKELKKARTDDLITIYTGPASVVYPLVQETVATAVMQLVSPVIAENYAEKIGIGDLEAVEELAQSQRVLINLQSLSGGQLQVGTLAQRGTQGLLLGCVALVLLIWCLFCAIDLGTWRQSNQVLRMCMVRNPVAVLAPRAAATLMPALVAGLGCSWILGVALQGTLAMAGYLAFLWAAALLLSGLPGLLNALPVLMPFAAALTLLLSPAIFDIGIYFPRLSPLCDLLPVSLLLKAAQADWKCVAIVWTECLVLVALLLLSEMRIKKVR